MKMRHRQMEIDSRTEETIEQRRIKRKLLSHSVKYKSHKKTRPQPWSRFYAHEENVTLFILFTAVPTQKMSRLITTSYSACLALSRKSKMMGIDTEARETEDAQIASIMDARKKWNVNPAFT